MITRRDFLQSTALTMGAALGPLTVGQNPQNPVRVNPPPPPPPRFTVVNPVVGLVLAGGGAKGSFEIGAVRYLYNQGIRPNIICGTSVGAINAIKLAEGEPPSDKPDPNRGLAGVEAIWRELKHNQDMYSEAPFLQWLRTNKPSVYKILPPLLAPPEAEGSVTISATNIGTAPVLSKPVEALLGPLLVPHAIVSSAYVFTKGVWDEVLACADLGDVKDKFGFYSPQSLYSLAPIKQLLQTKLRLDLVQQWAAAGGKLRLATVALESGKLRYVTESGQLLERDNSTLVAQVMPNTVISPACQSIWSALNQVWQAISSDLASAPPPDDPQFDAWNTNYQDLLARAQQLQQSYADCQQSNPSTSLPDPRPGVMASAALPAFFEPVEIAGENYVDGGIRDVMPISMAIQLGANVIYAINDSPALGAERLYAYTYTQNGKTFVDIAERALAGIAVDEVVHESSTCFTKPAQTQVTIIQCTFARDLDTVQVHPALIRINMSYGYMRAADTVNPVTTCPARCSQLSDSITMLRRVLFDFENRVIARFGYSFTDPNLDLQLSVPALRWGKGMLSLLIKERENLGGPIPQDIYDSSFSWEQHNLTLPAPTPFHAIGPVPADIHVADFIPGDKTLIGEAFGANAGRVYVILGGAKFLIKNTQELIALGFQPSATVHSVPPDSIAMLASIPWEGTLIKELSSPNIIYLIQNCAKRHVNQTAFNNHHFNTASVLTAPDGSLASIPNGPDLTS